jgi:hypothetical protein
MKLKSQSYRYVELRFSNLKTSYRRIRNRLRSVGMFVLSKSKLHETYYIGIYFVNGESLCTVISVHN